MKIFVIVALLAQRGLAASVDGCYGDRDNDHRPRVNCSSAGFSDIPDGLEPSTQVLLFPRNLISSLSWASFQIFAELYEIDLTGNKLPAVPSGSALPSLAVLRLGWNRLTSLSDGSFTACPALIHLELNNNNIRSLSDATFSGLSKLEILDLSHNKIQTLPPALLHPLPALETLLLEHNKIRMMPDGWFDKKPEIPYLFLSANPWLCVCPLQYFSIFLLENGDNVYVLENETRRADERSVVCQTPLRLKERPVIDLNEAELCPVGIEPEAETEPTTPLTTAATAALPIASTTVASITEATTEDSRGSTTEATTGSTSVAASLSSSTISPFHEVTWENFYTPTEEPQVSTSSWKTHHGLGRATGNMAATGASRMFCFWLFAGGLLLCLLSVLCVLMVLGSLVVWYRRRFKPVRGSGEKKEAVELLQYGAGSSREVSAVYRSMLFVSREGGDSSGGSEEFSQQEAQEGWQDGLGENQIIQRHEWRMRDGGEATDERRFTLILKEGSKGGWVAYTPATQEVMGLHPTS